MIQLGICDTDKKRSIKIEQILRKLYGGNIKLHIFESKFALEKYVVDIRQGKVDILFVNVNEGNRDLILSAKGLKEKYNNMKIALIGEKAEKILEHISLEPSWMILKPLTEEKIQGAMNHLLVQLTPAKKKLWIFEGHGGMFLIPKEEILYLESDHREIRVVMTDYRMETGSGKLVDFLEDLGEEFYLCHQSYIVNMEKVWKLNQKEVVLKDQSSVPVSRPRYKETKEALKRFAEKTV